MRRHRREKPVELLRSLLEYDPETGDLTWKYRPPEAFQNPRQEVGGRQKTQGQMASAWNTRWAGKPAFTSTRGGYRVGAVHQTLLFAHRVVWAMHHGEWPPHEMEVDHINGDRADNRIVNLRVVTPLENSRNKRLQKINRSGYSGVQWSEARERWEATISDRGTSYHLGSYHTKAEAVAARNAAERVLGYHEKHGRVDRPAYDDPARPSRARKKAGPRVESMDR